jgi:serine/threonine protein kinase
MSRVFLAEERALRRRVVIKVLAPEIAHDVSAGRLAREILLSSQLQHPNIVPIFTGGTPFHFVTDGIHAALKRATEAAQGKDVRRGERTR